MNHATAPLPLRDALGRTARYLRISLTDRCNLRCLYCRSGNEPFIPHPHILRYEELLDLISLAVEHGVEKIRITGGEPFARKGCLDFLERVRTAHPHLNIRLTTNGTLISPYLNGLRDLGINAINLSLDTFRPERYLQITGHDLFHKAADALERLLDSGIPLKINAVALRGINSDELPAFLNLACEQPVDVRFIEFMPMGQDTRWSHELFWSAEDILEQARTLVNLQPLLTSTEQGPDADAGPARLFTLPGKGRFGLITPLTNHFCMQCNRLRITSDGRLRTCLFDDREYRLREMLRHPRLGMQAVRRVLWAANLQKPVGARLLEQKRSGVTQKRMHAIGG